MANQKLRVKVETTSGLEVKGIKKEIVEEFDFINKNVKIESKDDESMLKFFKNIEFSDDVKPKVEVKDELIEPKNKTDDELQNGISVLEKLDDIEFSDDVKPKVEVEDKLIEPKKETDDEFQNCINVLETMDV